MLWLYMYSILILLIHFNSFQDYSFLARSLVPRGNDMHSSAVHRNPDFSSLPSIKDQQDRSGVLTGVVSQSNVTRNMTW